MHGNRLSGSGHFVLGFTTTDKFDVASEPENPINGHGGRSFLVWLEPLLMGAGYACGQPFCEDWGWWR